MFCALLTSRYQVSVYRTNGPLIIFICNLGLGQEMTLTFNTHLVSFYILVVCIYQFSGLWLHKCLKYPLFSLFSYSKALFSKFELAVKYIKVTPGSSFEETMMGWSPQCYIPSVWKSARLFQRRRFFEGFLPYMGMAAILIM